MNLHHKQEIVIKSHILKRDAPHLYTIDLLRGVAAIMVVLFHYSSTGLSKLTNEPARNLFSNGYLGVEIFFVISGFIIPFTLNKSNYSAKNFLSYMGKRITRICPPAYIIMILTILQFYFIDYFHLSKNIWFETITFTRVVHNFLFIADLTHYEWLTGIMWTLAVEFQFYIFVGLFFTLMYKNFRSFSIFTLAICGSFYLIPSNYKCFFLYGSLFVMGGAASLFFEGKILKSQYIGLLLITAIVCYLQLGIWPAILGTLTALLISFASIKNSIGTFLGKISYSLYLSHILVGSTIENLIVKIIPHQSQLQKNFCITLIFGISILAAYIYYSTVELYFLRFSNYLFGQKTEHKESIAVV